MAINIGAMFAPSAATAITNWHLGKYGLVYNGEIPSLAHKVLAGDAAAADSVSALAAKSGMEVGESVSAFCTNYLETLSSAGFNSPSFILCLHLLFL